MRASSAGKSSLIKARPSELKSEENPEGTRRKKEEKKKFRWNGGKKTEREKDNNFKSADLPQIQNNAVIFVPWPSYGVFTPLFTAIKTAIFHGGPF
jgi:hypothetical protein